MSNGMIAPHIIGALVKKGVQAHIGKIKAHEWVKIIERQRSCSTLTSSTLTKS